jgi:hypothetical protein
MSTYAHLPISGLLPQSATSALYIPTANKSTHTCIPSTSIPSASSGYWLSDIKEVQVPPPEDDSLDTLNDTLNDSNNVLRTPAKERQTHENNVPSSAFLFWLDEQTLTSTPRTLLFKAVAFESTPKHDRQYRQSSPRSLFPSEESILPVEIEDETDLDTLSLVVNDSLPRHGLRQEVHKSLPPILDTTVTTLPLPKRHLPRLRRSNGSDNLRFLYRSETTPELITPARLEGPSVTAMSFEEQLTKAILAEMDRFPNRFSAPRSGPKSRASHVYFGRSALSILGNAMRDVGSLMTRVP